MLLVLLPRISMGSPIAQSAREDKMTIKIVPNGTNAQGQSVKNVIVLNKQ
jgi:hypothetical protein